MVHFYARDYVVDIACEAKGQRLINDVRAVIYPSLTRCPMSSLRKEKLKYIKKVEKNMLRKKR